jgi:1-acyl-sn-glycerol-3-phosphate acyltransferase
MALAIERAEWRAGARSFSDTVFRTVVGIALLPPALAAASLAILLLALTGAPRAWTDRLYTGFAHLGLRVAGTRLEVRGLEHLEAGRAYVVVSNHESDWDPVVLMAALDRLPLRAVIKEQMMRIPIFGRALLLSGNVRVERTQTAADVQRIRAVMAARPSDVSMIFYAEGTRSRDGAFHGFKKGAFATAIAQGLPVLPVGTAGTRRIWPPRTLRLRSGPAVVAVGAPIPVARLTLDDRDRLRDEAHGTVGALRALARQRLRALGTEPGGVD